MQNYTNQANKLHVLEYRWLQIQDKTYTTAKTQNHPKKHKFAVNERIIYVRFQVLSIMFTV